MADYIHPDDFALLLNVTPYQVLMWLTKETKYEPPWETYLEPPTLSPPEFWNRNPPPPPEYSEHSAEINHTKTVFKSPEKKLKPYPFISDARFALKAFTYCYKEKEERDVIDWYRSVEEVIRIYIKSDEEDLSLTRVVGEYSSEWHELADYMKQIRDALVEKFPEVGGENSETSTTEPLTQIDDSKRDTLLPKPAKGKVRGPNSATIKAIDKLFEYRQEGWDGGFGDMPYWTHVCGEVGISPKTAKKYAPNLHENFRDKNYKWDWYKEDLWWEDSSS